jgi:molybdopterin synthase sulfur carrier subunit
MPLQILLNATLRQFVPGYDPYRGISLKISPGIPVSQIISRLEVPPEEVALILVNGVRQGADFLLQGDERVGLFPPIGGG